MAAWFWAFPAWVWAATAPLPPIALAPTRVSAHSPMVLRLSGGGFDCHNDYFHYQYRIQGDSLMLDYSQSDTRADTCPVGRSRDQGPEFPIPGLRAGTYKVYVGHVPDCAVAHCDPNSGPCAICLIGWSYTYAGNLTVSESIIPQVQVPDFRIVPSRIPAGVATMVKLASDRFSCHDRFSGLGFDATTGDLYLDFRAGAGDSAACAPGPAGPVFQAPALAPGAYPVYAPVSPCVFLGPEPEFCARAELVGYYGLVDTLRVDSARPPGWFLETKTAKAGAPFTLRILNQAYGTCQSTFGEPQATVSGGAIHVSATLQTDGSRFCVRDERPSGPSFTFQGLGPGAYPVYFDLQPHCEVAGSLSICPVDRMPGELVDTLRVTGPASLARARAVSAGATLALGHLRVTLPGRAAGPGRAALYSLDGSRIAALEGAGDADGALVFALPAGLRPGLYWLRLDGHDRNFGLAPIRIALRP